MQNKAKKGEYLGILLRSNKTIFSTKDVSLLWGEENSTAVRNRLSNYVKTGKLIRLRRGLYAKDKNYNKRELAVSVYTPSYISFETALALNGLIFQFYSEITVASYLTRTIKIDNQTFSFKKLKDSILTNKEGLEKKDGYYIASAERAFLDKIYLHDKYYFDNLSSLSWDKVYKILPIYNSKRMEKSVKNYKENVER